jgi:tellurite resistance protein TehA-like permease
LIGFGDHWIVAGSVAIAALAAARLTSVPWWTGTSHQLLRVTTIVLVAIALAGYAVLVVAEIRWPRPHYDIRRWATIFPLGMTAVMCLTASLAVGIGWLLPLGRVLLWIAVAGWLVTAYGLVATETARSRAS